MIYNSIKTTATDILKVVLVEKFKLWKKRFILKNSGSVNGQLNLVRQG